MFYYISIVDISGNFCGKNIVGSRTISLAVKPKIVENLKPKTGILMLNMGGPTNTDQVGEYLLRIMTDRDMIQLPVQRYLLFISQFNKRLLSDRL